MRNVSDGRSPFLWRLRPYFRQVAGLLLIGSVTGVLMNTAVVLPPLALGNAINIALAAGRHRATSTDIGWAALLFVAATAATEVPRMAKRWWLNGVAANRFRAGIQSDALRGVLGWPLERIATTSVGDVMTRIVGDVDVLVLGIRNLFVETWDTLLFSLSMVVAMFVLNAPLAALALAPVPVALVLAGMTGRWVARRTRLSRVAAASLSTALHEHLSGVRVLRLFGRGQAANQRIRAFAEGLATAELAKIKLEQALTGIYAVLMTSGVVAIVAYGGARVAAGQMTLGALVAFLQLFTRFLTKAPQIPQMANRLQAAGAAYWRIEPLLAAPLGPSGTSWASFRFNLPATAVEETRPPAGQEVAPAVSAERITFRYPGSAAPALSEVSFEIPAGALIAVTGPVGAGKSALARALSGLWPLESGRVLLDGRPLTGLGPLERSSAIGYLAQDAHLFSGSLVDNLVLAADPVPSGGASTGMVTAARLASLDRDLAEMPEGLDTQIGELGVRLSGGQRKRVALARALAGAGRTPGLLVLDDPFSAVDVVTETEIVAALRTAFGPQAAPSQRRTIVLCTHRVAAFPRADFIIVLDRGAILEVGTHADLLKAAGLYARIFRAQSRLARPGTPS
jgi:ATP-binding cassette subfamily B multidrug efflux pump